VGSFDHFALLMSTEESSIAVEEAALVLSSVFRTGLDVDHWLGRLDDLAAGCGSDLESVTRRLFGELGFEGNRCGYYDPRNSWLDLVIERRTGIPITLSIVLMAVGRRVGLDIVGVGMPSHFLALDRGSGSFVDGFDGGALLDRSGVDRLFTSLHEGIALDDAMLAPVGTRTIVRRMLNNLVHIAMLERDPELRVTATKLRSLLPDATTSDRLELAGAYMAQGEVLRAADVLDAAAAEAPDHEHDAIVRYASEVRARLN
jgi:regulator of sirC expression with transglutaminase-like and TPR domain